MTTPKNKQPMAPGSNYIQTIHNLILTIMNWKSQRDIALVRGVRARDVPRTENCRRLIFATVFTESCLGISELSESDGLGH